MAHSGMLLKTRKMGPERGRAKKNQILAFSSVKSVLIALFSFNFFFVFKTSPNPQESLLLFSPEPL
jgi:hypothetical protein